MYKNGQGVRQDYTKAVEGYRKAAEQGCAAAQYNLGSMYLKSEGVAQDFATALKWLQFAAERGCKIALQTLDIMQQRNALPTPPPGTPVTAILLTSAAGSKHNNNRVAVLLDGAATNLVQADEPSCLNRNIKLRSVT